MNLSSKITLPILGVLMIHASTALAVGENLAGQYRLQGVPYGTGDITLVCPAQIAISVGADAVVVQSGSDSFDRRYSMSGFNQGIYACNNNGGIFNECNRTSGNQNSITTDIGENRIVYFTVDFSYSILRAGNGIQIVYKNEQSVVSCNYVP